MKKFKASVNSSPVKMDIYSLGRDRSWKMGKTLERYLAFAFGIIFVASILLIAIYIPSPTRFQEQIFRITLSVSAAGFVTFTPGFIEITISNWVRAGGALAVFLIVYFYNPASLIAQGP
jgi:hypothetical protein